MPSEGSRKRAKPRQRHVPTRMCVVCRETNAKRTLTRTVRTSDTTFQVDSTGRADGRGAYVCDKATCWDKATSTPILARALRVNPDNDSIDHLREFAAGLNLEAGEKKATVGSEE